LIELTIPGRGTIRLKHLVSDVNGTLALDGQLLDGTLEALLAVSDRLQLHLLTADTHGRQAQIDEQLGLQAVRIPKGAEVNTKAAYVRELGAENVIALGQGANDAGMLREAAIGIAIASLEGLAIEALTSANIVVPDIDAAFELLENPTRLVATLRR
jgi:P-type E1-E2 ATPase